MRGVGVGVVTGVGGWLQIFSNGSALTCHPSFLDIKGEIFIKAT